MRLRSLLGRVGFQSGLTHVTAIAAPGGTAFHIVTYIWGVDLVVLATYSPYGTYMFLGPPLTTRRLEQATARWLYTDVLEVDPREESGGSVTPSRNTRGPRSVQEAICHRFS